MDQALQQKLLDYLNGIEKAVVELTPQAYEIAKQVVRMDAAMDLIAGVVWLIVGVVFATIISNMAMATHKKVSYGENPEWDDSPWFSLGIVGRFLGWFIAIGNLLGIAMDKHIWFGLFAPELEIVRQLYSKLIGTEG